MPVDAIRKIPVEQTDKPFNRLALRCSLQAELQNNQIKVGSTQTLSIHATRYRKLKRTSDSIDVVEVCGQDDADSGLAAIHGDNSGNDDLILALARRCRNYAIPAGGSATINLNFSWTRRAGDIKGQLHLVVTPVPAGTPIQIATPDVDETGLVDQAFADFFQSLISAIKNRSDGLGW
ncbi:MAG: hypothetical protein U1F59_09720 [Candidatus Competibacteraceae bacterium]